MSDPTVINLHHHGGDIKALPPNTVYVGRPGLFGNSHSMKDGRLSKEMCVALHRIDLYRMFKNDPAFFQKVKDDLTGHDLACWCKQAKRYSVCHGDNYLHVLKDSLKDRTYDKHPVIYLMDDLRTVLQALGLKISSDINQQDWMAVYINQQDVIIDVTYAIYHAKLKEIDPDIIALMVSQIVIDLEAALADPNPDMVSYRLLHVLWVIEKSAYPHIDENTEPQPPKKDKVS